MAAAMFGIVFPLSTRVTVIQIVSPAHRSVIFWSSARCWTALLSPGWPHGLLHATAAAIPAAVFGHVPAVLGRIWRVWDPILRDDRLGAPHESQDHEAREEPTQLQHFLRGGRSSVPTPHQ